jgi:hypothetical protein
MRPGRHCAGGGIWRGEHAEFGNSAASAELAFRLHWKTDSAVSLVGYSSLTRPAYHSAQNALLTY